MHTLIRAGFIALAFLCSMDVRAQEAIPPSLRDWQGWVLHGEEFRRCPLATSFVQPGAPVSPGQYRCVWPERLTLTVDARGGTFSQRWQVYAESWVALPGSFEHWPRDVRLNGAPAAVVAVNEVPNLRLPPGSYVISGSFSWSSRPEALLLPDATAIVDLSVDGSRVAQPERPDGGVWLGKRRSAEQPANMEVQVYRLIRDDIPVYLVTRLRLNVAGDAREEVLARVLPEGFTPVSLTGALPARLERDGRLRVQVRPGSHEVTAGGARCGCCHELRAAGRERRQMGARGNLELRLERPAARRGCRRAPRASIPHRPTCRVNGASTPPSAWMPPRNSRCRSAAGVS